MTEGFHFGDLAVGTILFGRSLLACVGMQRVPFLPLAGDGPAAAVAVILVARRADAFLAACLDDLAGQSGCELSTVVVADRAPDAPEIAALCAGRDRVALIQVDRLDAGSIPWIEALRAGAAVVANDARWILWLETPCRLRRRDSIARAARHLEDERAAALWLVPRLRTPLLLTPPRLTALADAMPAFAAANRDRESVHWPGLPGLCARDALVDALSDPRAASSAVLEGLVSERLHRAQRRVRYAFAADEVDAGTASWSDVGESAERLFATIGFRPAVVGLGLLLFALIWGWALGGAFRDGTWSPFAFAGLLSLAIPAYLVARATAANPLPALLAPFAFPIEAVATLWIVVRATRVGGVRWRGTFVPLERLRTPAEHG